MIITGVRLCGRHLQLRRLLICNCEKLSISARLMQRLHHWPHQLPAGSELIRLLLLMGQRGRGERKGAALSGDVPAAPSPWTRGQRGSPRRGKHIASGDWTRACLLVPVPGEGPHRRWHLARPAGAVSAGSGSPRAPVGTAAGLMPSCSSARGTCGTLAQIGFVARSLWRAAPCPSALLPQELSWQVSSFLPAAPQRSWGLVRPCCVSLCPTLAWVSGEQASPAHAPHPSAPCCSAPCPSALHPSTLCPSVPVHGGAVYAHSTWTSLPLLCTVTEHCQMRAGLQGLL